MNPPSRNHRTFTGLTGCPEYWMLTCTRAAVSVLSNLFGPRMVTPKSGTSVGVLVGGGGVAVFVGVTLGVTGVLVGVGVAVTVFGGVFVAVGVCPGVPVG